MSIFISFLLVTAVVLAFNHIFPHQSWFHFVLYVAGIWFFLMVIRFFRSPVREVKGGKSLIVSPADGRVVVVEKTFESELFKKEMIQVSVFMSARNVHVNWFPVSGNITYYHYHPGKHLVAFNPKASLENERTTTVIETPDGKHILIRQIAGAVARRVKCYPVVGEPVTQGDELGFIKFGSRVDLLLPADTRIDVSIGQNVTGKQTVIGRLA